MNEREELLKEVKLLRRCLSNCLDLIEDLSLLDAPLFEADISREFKIKYIKIVSRAKKALIKDR